MGSRAILMTVIGVGLLFASPSHAETRSETIPDKIYTLGAKPTCDNTTHICRTNILEVHQDSVGETRIKILYDAPPGVQFIGHQWGVELEAGGADHHVHAYSEGPGSFSCEWYAKKKFHGDNGLAKGYCEAEFSGTATAMSEAAR
ncbi:hypothetical protein [Bradyrhizobium cenepequi]